MSRLEILGIDDPTDDQPTDETPAVDPGVAPVEVTPSLEALYARHADALARALHAAGVPEANDAVQEAFVQAVVHWKKVARYDDPLAWIRRVAINRGHNRRRARRRRQALTERIASTPAAPNEPAASNDDLALLVASLPPQQRLALSLYYYADLSVAEVAHAMRLTTGAVKYHLHAARASLAQSLESPDAS